MPLNINDAEKCTYGVWKTVLKSELNIYFGVYFFLSQFS